MLFDQLSFLEFLPLGGGQRLLGLSAGLLFVDLECGLEQLNRPELKRLIRRTYRIRKIGLNYDLFTAIIMARVIVVHNFLRSLLGPLETALFLLLFLGLPPLVHLGLAFDAGRLFLLLLLQLALLPLEGFEACVLFELGNKFFSQLNGA